MSTKEDLAKEVERLRKENERLRARKSDAGLQLKISQKGGVSVYGLGRFPVTLYKDQWVRLLDIADQIRAFMVEHDAELKKRET